MRLQDHGPEHLEELRKLGSWLGRRERQAVSTAAWIKAGQKVPRASALPPRGVCSSLTHFPQFQKEICKELLNFPASSPPQDIDSNPAIRCTNFHHQYSTPQAQAWPSKSFFKNRNPRTGRESPPSWTAESASFPENSGEQLPNEGRKETAWKGHLQRTNLGFFSILPRVAGFWGEGEAGYP